jgi:4'-phosphopantetheinyl transferase
VGLELHPGEIHLWLASLALTAYRLEAFEGLLSSEERERADRYRFAQHRNRFIAARGFLRILLGRYLDTDPAKIQIFANRYGKPYLAGHSAQSDPRFNLSHSADLAVLAFALGSELGVDLERIAAQRADMEIARRFFSSAEVAALNSLGPGDRERAFFTCWVRKEAYIKACGEGLRFPLDAFSVSLSPNAPPALLENQLDPQEVSRWRLQELDLGPHFVGALVAPAKLWTIEYFRLAPGAACVRPRDY